MRRFFARRRSWTRSSISSRGRPRRHAFQPRRSSVHSDEGLLIVNADDWGRDARTTDMIAACVSQHTGSSVSAMVFMEDSERAAAIARANGIDAGLHLNLTTPFTSRDVDARVAV